MSDQPPSYQPPPVTPTSTNATISLIAGILGLTFFPFIGSIIAVILGNMAKKEISQSRGMIGGEGLAKAGVILGWIGIALGVLGICVAILAFAIPFVLILLGISSSDSSMILPVVLALI